MSNSEDYDAIKNYFSSQTPKNATALDVKTAFVQWDSAQNRSLITGGTSDSQLAQAKTFRDQYNKAEMPAAVALHANDPQLTAEETKYVMNMPIVNTTGLSAAAAHKAVMSAPRNPAPSGSAFAVSTGNAPPVQTSHKQIKKGASGADVKAWQAILGMVQDGKFGPQTEAATKKWQSDHGLKGDGIVGPGTWAKAAEVANPNGTPAVSTPSQVASVTGKSTVGPATQAATPAQKSTVAAATTGAVTVTPITQGSSTFQKAVDKINQETKTVEAGMLGIGGKVPTWAWAAAIGTFLAAAAYAVFGKPKFDQRKRLS